MDKKSDPEETKEITYIKRITKELEAVNKELQTLLVKLPLSHYNEIARLHALVNEQVRLLSIPPKGEVPPRIKVFFDNARDSALFLKGKYTEASLNGKIRKAETYQEKTDI